MFRMHQPRNLLEFSSQTEVRFLLLVRDTGYTVASRVVLHRGSGAVLLPRDQAAMLDMLQPTRSGNINWLLLTKGLLQCWKCCS